MYELPADTRLVFEDRGDYLYAEVIGPRDNREISLAYWSRIAERCQARGTTHLLVVENLGEHEGERDMPSMIDALIAMGLGKLRIAFVDRMVSHLPAMEYGEILAMERGATGRVFGSVPEAERWLRHGNR